MDKIDRSVDQQQQQQQCQKTVKINLKDDEDDDDYGSCSSEELDEHHHKLMQTNGNGNGSNHHQHDHDQQRPYTNGSTSTTKTPDMNNNNNNNHHNHHHNNNRNSHRNGNSVVAVNNNQSSSLKKQHWIQLQIEANELKHNDDELITKKGFTIFGYKISQIKWINVFWLAFIHLLAVVGYAYLALYPVKFWSVWWTIFLGAFGGFGVSVGAHRLWAHRSFKARWLLRFFLVLIETLSMNGGCYSYARDHRCHHKFVDTNGDPKNAKRGFFFAHIGWWMLKKHPDVLRMGKKLDHYDLNDEPLIVWQKRLYFPLFLLMSVVMPTLVPYYGWNEDIWTAFFIASVLRTVVVVHHLFTVNSIAHIWGIRPYNCYIGPTESKLTMYLSMGEGSHNYHHTFPMDYANCEKKWWEVFNPSTLFVDVCQLLGLAYDLKKPSPEVIKGIVSRKGDPNFYEHKLLQQRSMFRRIRKGLYEWTMGVFVAGWAIYPPIMFKVITGRPLFVF